MRERKNPVASALLSIIPGVGHFYINSPFMGTLYLFLFWIGGLVMLVVSRAQGSYRPMWIMMGTVMVVSMLHAVWATRKYNQEHDEAGGED